MGLFDPPTKSIAKRVPISAQIGLSAVQTYAESRVFDYHPPVIKAAMVAIVMASWVNVHAQIGTFDMRPYDFEYIRNVAVIQSKIAKNHLAWVEQTIRELIDTEMMPDIFG